MSVYDELDSGKGTVSRQDAREVFPLLDLSMGDPSRNEHD